MAWKKVHADVPGFTLMLTIASIERKDYLERKRLAVIKQYG